MTTKDGKRSDTYTAYLKPILHRKNLHVIRYAHVQKILLDGMNKASGVIYKRNGELITVNAKEEVIVSAGGIASPQILMLSGIGAAQHLNSVGVSLSRLF